MEYFQRGRTRRKAWRKRETRSQEAAVAWRRGKAAAVDACACEGAIARIPEKLTAWILEGAVAYSYEGATARDLEARILGGAVV